MSSSPSDVSPSPRAAFVSASEPFANGDSASSARSCASMPLCSAAMSARIFPFSSRSACSSAIAAPYLASSSVCFSCSRSTRSASARHRSASSTARSPSLCTDASISSAMAALRVAAVRSVCSREVFCTRLIASTADCSSMARMCSSSSSSCAAAASCAAASALSAASRCLKSASRRFETRASCWRSCAAPSSRSSSRTRWRRRSFSLACSRAFRATISISRLRAVRLRAMGLQARLDARFENCAASRSGDRASATHGRRIPEGSRPSPSSSDELPPESASLRERRRRGVRASASEVEDERGTGLQQAKRARTAKKSNQPSFAPRGDAGDRRADQDDERAGDTFATKTRVASRTHM